MFSRFGKQTAGVIFTLHGVIFRQGGGESFVGEVKVVFVSSFLHNAFLFEEQGPLFQ